MQRQYTGTAGRIENSQVGVFLSYASARGRALIDRRVYLPKSWTNDPQRCAAAGVPAEAKFAAKPGLALDMITGAVAATMPAAWAASDELYGDNGAFRAAVAKLGLGYVLAVSCDHRIPAFPGGRRRLRADQVAAAVPSRCWQRISAGTGSKGPRWYDWAWASACQPGHSLLIRRGSTGELAFYRCWSPVPVPLAALVRVAGMRWSVEEQLQAAKGQAGLDHYQVRTWTGWHRHVILAILAQAFLMASAATVAPAPAADPWHHARHGGADHADRRGNPAAVPRPGPRPAPGPAHHAAARDQRHPALVQLAPPPSRPGPPQPLPAQTRHRTRPITK